MAVAIKSDTLILLVIWILFATLLINGLTLKAAAVLTRAKIHFGFAMLVTLAATLASGMITYALLFLLASPTEPPAGGMMFAIYAPGIVTSLIITAILGGMTATNAEGEKIGFGKGLRIATIQLAFTFAIGIIAGVIYIAVMAT